MRYRMAMDRIGNVLITDTRTKACVYLQGDDALTLHEDVELVDAMWADDTAYKGPWTSYGEHLDAILDQYSVAMTEEYA